MDKVYICVCVCVCVCVCMEYYSAIKGTIMSFAATWIITLSEGSQRKTNII